ncbi:outer membrane beta-barrel family protein [Thermoflavifilum thermophilum]|uniref:Outer membrane protein beta-barrel family protein n=1 Tax=Thermoflavifilum thermophilum TaxID=1393122 RepID=A0A1I7NM34_9BACT|nr:outer membrane beta-barrel family protein [Thermoflavifilum thermophilum]SFV35705.1 Outer membrane protein beta-barrel family protein [Thermoflavifilum thermophilum]
MDNRINTNLFLNIRWILIFKSVFLISTILLFSYFFSYAQKVHAAFTIQVLDSSLHPIPGIFVQINDSARAQWNFSDSSGIVEFDDPNCTYCHLQLRGIGYVNVDTFVQYRPMYAIKFILAPALHALKGVEIQSQRPRIISKNEKIIFNWNQLSEFKKGETIWDLLGMTPLVHTINNKLKVLDNENVVIFINGKRQIFSNEELINYLKSMPADRIVQFEIIPIPPANYHVEAGQSVINIVLKKELKDYLGGNISMSALQNSYFNPAAIIHIDGKAGKFSFSNTEYISNSGERDRFTKNYDELQTGYQFLDTYVKNRNRWRIMGSYLYANYDIDTQQSLSTVFFFDNLRSHPTKPEVGDALYFSNSSSTLTDSVGTTYSILNEDSKDVGYTFDYTLNKNKLKINAEIGQIYYNDINQQMTRIESRNENKHDTLFNFIQRINQSIKNTNFYFKIDYTLAKNIILSSGINGYLTNNDSQVNWENFDVSDYVIDSSLSNKYLYVENNFYPFINFSSEIFHKLTINAGVKYEIANNNGKLNNYYIFKRNKSTLIPTFIFSYQINSNDQIVYSYASSKIWPSFWQLNPIRWYQSANDFVEENPYLESAQQNEHMLRYAFHQKHQFILDYKIIKNDYGQYYIFGPNHSITTTRVNFDYTKNFNFNYVTTLSFLHQHVMLNPEVAFNYNQIKGKDTIYADYHKISAMVQLNAQIILSESKNWDCTINGAYYSPSLSGIYENDGLASISMEIKKSIKKWNFGLLVQDPFKMGTIRSKVLTNQPVDMHVSIYADNFFVRFRAVLNFWKNIQISERSMQNQSILERLGH